MQDGQLGQPGSQTEADDMQIRVGDEVHYHPQGPPALPPQQQPSLIRKALPYILSAALGGGGATGALLPWLLSKVPDPPAVTDTDTTRRIEIDKWVPEPEG